MHNNATMNFSPEAVRKMAGTVAVEQQLCLNSLYRKAACRRCLDSCPEQCISTDLVVDGKRCSECGLCLASCPAEAIAGENFSRQALDSLVTEAVSPLVLTCRRVDETSPWPCLGFLDARLLLALAGSGRDSRRQVAVDDTACAGCRPHVAAYLQELVEQVAGLLSPEDASLLLQGSSKRPERREKAISRRDFFAQLLEATIGTVREVVAVSAGGGEPLPRRALYAKYAGGMKLAVAGTTRLFYNIAISDSCQACGFCTRICPAKAVTLQDHGSYLEFYHHPGLCTGCGVCVAHCPSGALILEAARELAAYHVARRDLPRCTKCGQLYQPSGNKPVCLECLLKNDYRGIY